MIDERHEELAALHALDLLEGEERAAFERELAINTELRALVDSLREASAALAHTAPDAPLPAELRARVLASVDEPKVIRPPVSVFRSLIPWAAAACFALAAAWLGQMYLAAKSETQLLSAQQTLADLALKSAQNQLEAERIIARKQHSDLTQQVNDGARQLADATTKLTTAEQLIAATRSDLETERTASRQRIAELDRQIAAERTKSGDRLRDLTEARRLLAAREAELRDQTQLLASIEERARRDSDLANFKIATLASMLKNSPEAVGVAVWNPTKQEGVFTLEKAPALKAGQSLELWVVPAKEGAKPVSAGVITMASAGVTRLSFKPTVPVEAIAAFAVSREKNDGVRAHAAPAEVIMVGNSR